MLKLKNVSKFYYSKGVVASGFSKVNLELNMGEFVAITGESGSGKSTLLNVISGLDTYEEGEMYINGEETSHYTEKDFEDYRRKYIGNIFQHFNLINSYTVYQNVELILLINGAKSKDIKKKVLDIIRQVDLYRYRNTKVSKLSGGQKQRVAIARALAKETPIIVADEPTGNLDSRAAESVMRTLHEISKDKLVVIVTHNYEQVEEYATRKIKMHDGKIIEDKVLKKTPENIEAKVTEYKEITNASKLKLGIRNAFNIVPKFLLLLLVYGFITLAVTGAYSSLRKQEDTNTLLGYNNSFNDNDVKRIVIKKSDGTPFTDEDYQKIEGIEHVDRIIKNDLILDSPAILNNNNYYLDGYLMDISNFEGKVDIGRMPENDKEIIIYGEAYDYYLSQASKDILDKEFAISGDYQTNDDGILDYKLKVVGIKYYENTQSIYSRRIFYVYTNVIEEMQEHANQDYSEIEYGLNGKRYKANYYSNQYRLVPNQKVPKGQIYIPEYMNMYCKKYKCVKSTLTAYVKNLYYDDALNFKITKTYNKKNYTKLTGLKKFEERDGEFYISPYDYDKLFNKPNYQSTVYIDSEFKAKEVTKSLNDMGITTLYLKDTLVNPLDEILQFTQIFRVVLIAGLMVGLFFISYFIIKLILKSRNIYFSTIRILGATRKVAKRLLDIELLTVINIAYGIFLTLVILVKANIVKFDYVKNLTEYLTIVDFIVVYLLLVLMSWLISNRFARKLFKQSAMNTYREEV